MENISDPSKPVDYQQLLDLLTRGSALDLYRLSIAINLMLDDPQRVNKVKQQLRIDQVVDYFDDTQNRFVDAKVLKLSRTRITIKRLDDQKIWTIPYCAIRLPDNDVLSTPSREKLDRHSLQIGDKVGFTDNQGYEHYGTVAKLNPKTASLDCDNGRWRVAYSFLFPVIDSNMANAELSNIKQSE